MIDLFFLIVLAFILSAAFVGSGRRGPGVAAGLLFFFLLFLLFGWAASRWVVPVGPPVLGLYWLGPLTATVLLALILLAFIPPQKPRGRLRAEEQIRQERETPAQTEARHAVEVGFTAFFWIAVVGLVLVIASSWM